jgi:hypothetical protein
MVWRRRKVLGIITWWSCAGHVTLWDFGEYWRVMLSDTRRTSGPFVGADFAKLDAARLDAWRWTLESRRWLPIWFEAEEREAFETIEDSIRNAALNLPSRP